jgi:hypothetical protein
MSCGNGVSCKQTPEDADADGDEDLEKGKVDENASVVTSDQIHSVATSTSRSSRDPSNLTIVVIVMNVVEPLAVVVVVL